MDGRRDDHDMAAWRVADDDLLPGRAITTPVKEPPSHFLLMPAAKQAPNEPERDFWSHRLAPLRGFDDFDRHDGLDRLDDLRLD